MPRLLHALALVVLLAPLPTPRAHAGSRERVEALATELVTRSETLGAELGEGLEGAGIAFDKEAIPSATAYFSIQLYTYLDAGLAIRDAALRAARDVVEGDVGKKYLAYLLGTGSVRAATLASGATARRAVAEVFARVGLGFLRRQLASLSLGLGGASFRAAGGTLEVRDDDSADAAGRAARGAPGASPLDPWLAERLRDAYQGERITLGESVAEVALMVAVGSSLALLGAPSAVVVGGTFALSFLYDLLRRMYRELRDGHLRSLESHRREHRQVVTRLEAALRAARRPRRQGAAGLGADLRWLREPIRRLRRQVARMQRQVLALRLRLLGLAQRAAALALATDGLGALAHRELAPEQLEWPEPILRFRAPDLVLPALVPATGRDDDTASALFAFLYVDAHADPTSPRGRRLLGEGGRACGPVARAHLPGIQDALASALDQATSGELRPDAAPLGSFAAAPKVRELLARLHRSRQIATSGIEALLRLQELAEGQARFHLPAGPDGSLGGPPAFRAQRDLDEARLAALLATQTLQGRPTARVDLVSQGLELWRARLRALRPDEVALDLEGALREARPCSPVGERAAPTPDFQGLAGPES